MGGMDVHGSADGRFGPVRDGFTEVVRAQPGTGAGFAAWCEGRLVVDLWGGYADAERRRPWAADSLVQPYSVSKPFAAVCALRLVESGRLDLDAPVQRYWPEYGGAQDAGVVNSTAWRAAEIPAVNGHGTAAAVAGFYQTLTAGRLLSPGMFAEAVTPQCAGPDRVFGGHAVWGLGFGISPDGYGTGGLGGSYGGASTEGGYTLGFVTGSAGTHDGVDALENVLREYLGLPPI